MAALRYQPGTIRSQKTGVICGCERLFLAYAGHSPFVLIPMGDDNSYDPPPRDLVYVVSRENVFLMPCEISELPLVHWLTFCEPTDRQESVSIQYKCTQLADTS
jgi:hypothetical protein